MSLPNYLAKIKSSGVYRYVFDKSVIPSQTAETLRLVVGYSEKGPFNTPVYIDNKRDFISLYGNINKRLEKKGIFFHRLSLQALSAGPILALNVKPFIKQDGDNGIAEHVSYMTFDPWDEMTMSEDTLVDSTNNNVLDTINVYDLYDTNRFWKLDADQLPDKLNGNKYINITTTDIKDNSCTIFFRPYYPDSYDVTIRDWYTGLTDVEMPAYLDEYKDEKLNKYFGEIYVFKGKFTEQLCDTGGTLEKYFNVAEGSITLKSFYQSPFSRMDTLEALSQNPDSNFIGRYQGCMLPDFQDANGNYISLDILFNADHTNHKMLMKFDDSLIEEMLENHFNEADIYDKTWEDRINDSNPDNDTNPKFNLYTANTPIYLEGYTYSSPVIGKDADKAQKDILNMLTDEGIYTALTNHVDCEYHYIVDTFASYLDQHCKSVLSTIAKEKDNAFAILNFPAMKNFLEDNAFKNNNTGKFDVNLISKRPDKFSLPLEVDGASWCAFYTPVVLSDGTVKTTIPSASLVSNLYMEKWNSRQPYYIVAGPNYGRIQEAGLIGPDYNYSRTDLDVLEPLGANVIVYVPRKGTYINSNQTAKQIPVSALSKAHVRELVIYLQNEIESMLQNYQWELNTQTLRDTVKTKADTILENVMNNGGVYAYLNVCDESNNTPDVIDNEMIILDTSIEPARGAGKMVQRLTIHRTGGINSLTK